MKPPKGGTPNLYRNNFEVGIDFLFEHALNSHQGSAQRTGATAAGALITNAKSVVLQIDDFEITAVAHEIRPHFFIENFVDANQPRIVAGHSGNRATNRAEVAIRRSRN